MKLALLITLGAAVATLAAAAPAWGDPYSNVGYRGWGPRVGLSMSPDAVHFGAHLDYGNFAEHVRFQPNFELGIGDNHKQFAINAEAAYRFQSRWDVWSPYLGGGIGANIKTTDRGNGNDTRTDLGLNVLGGIEKGLSSGDRFFLELKLSLNDQPDAKITAGWTFYP